MLLMRLSLVSIEVDNRSQRILYNLFNYEGKSSMSMALLGPFGRIALDAPIYTLGSTPDNQLVLHDPKVSPRHALFQLQGQQYSIADLGSIDGTYLNEQRLGPNMPAFLKNGDRIRIGDTLYTFEASSLAAPAYVPTVAASSNPAYNPTVPAQQPPATPAYGQSNPAYGQAQQPPAYDPTVQAQPPVYGQSNPAYPVYGQAQPPPVAPVYGQTEISPASRRGGSCSSPNASGSRLTRRQDGSCRFGSRLFG